MAKSKSLGATSEKRYDNFNHWVEFDRKPSRSRCKFFGCKNFTHAYCCKCDVHLCCSVNHNCFRAFHTPLKSVKSAKTAKLVKQPKQMESADPVKRPKLVTKEKLVKLVMPMKSFDPTNDSQPGTSHSTLITNHDEPTSILKTSKPTMNSNHKNVAKKVQWKPDSELCQYESSNPPSNFGVSNVGKIRVVDLKKLQYNYVLCQRENRRKTQHQVKSLPTDELEFI